MGTIDWTTAKLPDGSIDWDEVYRQRREDPTIPPDEHLIPACQRVKVKNPAPGVYTAGGARLPIRYLEALEQDQQLAGCCRHPENHDLSAWYSCADDAAKGTPDVYVFHCSCGRVHRRFGIGGNPMKDGVVDYAALHAIGREEDKRPFWTVR